MNASTPALSHDQSADPTCLTLGSSTSKWYAEWKQKKSAAGGATTEPVEHPADGVDALTMWLAGDGK
jgi:hypothetical protein